MRRHTRSGAAVMAALLYAISGDLRAWIEAGTLARVGWMAGCVAAGMLAYFDALGQDDAPGDAPHPIATRERLLEYDPELFNVVHETMAYHGKVDWRFSPAGR